MLKQMLEPFALRSTVKCERFFVHACFSNEIVSRTTVTIGPLKMFRLEYDTMNVWRSNLFAIIAYNVQRESEIEQAGSTIKRILKYLRRAIGEMDKILLATVVLKNGFSVWLLWLEIIL